MKNKIEIGEVEIYQDEIKELMNYVFDYLDKQSFSNIKELIIIQLILDIMADSTGDHEVPKIEYKIRKAIADEKYWDQKNEK